MHGSLVRRNMCYTINDFRIDVSHGILVLLQSERSLPIILPIKTKRCKMARFGIHHWTKSINKTYISTKTASAKAKREVLIYTGL